MIWGYKVTDWHVVRVIGVKLPDVCRTRNAGLLFVTKYQFTLHSGVCFLFHLFTLTSCELSAWWVYKSGSKGEGTLPTPLPTAAKKCADYTSAKTWRLHSLMSQMEFTQLKCLNAAKTYTSSPDQVFLTKNNLENPLPSCLLTSVWQLHLTLPATGPSARFYRPSGDP